MSEAAILAYAIHLAHEAGRNGEKLTETYVTRLIAQAKHLAGEKSGRFSEPDDDQPIPGITLSPQAIALGSTIRNQKDWESQGLYPAEMLQELIEAGIVRSRRTSENGAQVRIYPVFEAHFDAYSARRDASATRGRLASS